MNQYSRRRQQLMDYFQSDCMVILFSGKAIMRSEDESYPFYVNRNFYYLTGLDSQDMVLLMYKLNGKKDEILFSLPYDEYSAKWVGGRMLPDKISEISEVLDVENLCELDSTVGSLLQRSRRIEEYTVYFDMWHYEFDQTNSLAINYANTIKNKYPSLIVKDIYSYLTHMRLLKDEEEVNCIRRAIYTTNIGVNQMMKSIRPNLNEMAMEGIFDFCLRQAQCKENAFPTIAASGVRATTLHYQDNNQTMLDGELFLCDLGATYNHYCADISRTFPVNGKFTDRQKEIYEVVLGAQKVVEENAKAGITLKQLNNLVIDYYKEELPKHGLNEDVRNYYYHSVSHQLGLDTHDVMISADYELRPGNVITNEPGLYIEEENMGIRIEDDLLILQDGCEVLSKEIIKSVEDIENLMNGQH